MIQRLIPLFLTLALPALAQDGGQLFRLYCSACHGADGKGATGGAFPPLAGSPWVTEDSERLIKLTLYGLTGPLEVNGKKYDGQVPMTPFGGMLNDNDVAAVLPRDGARERQSQARAAGRIAAGGLQPDKRLEHFFQPILGNARSVVVDGDDEIVALGDK